MSAPSPSAPTTAHPSLLFIPDISGFTRFVQDTEITHSQHIIEELLEVLLDANEIGLEVSEIEGDAVLFFREGPPPTAAELLAQVQRMYVRFHAHLRRYDSHRICRCGACNTASGLTLKFIAHYGEVGMNRVKAHSNLFGRDVIVAHRLMKNGVPSDEYVLLTHDLVRACANWVEVEQAAWAEPEQGAEEYDFGPVTYSYVPLDPLRAHVPEPTVEDHSLPGATVQALSHEAVVEAPLDLVFDVIVDLTARHLWQGPVKGSDRFNRRLSQHGAAHRCIIEDTEEDPYLVSHDFEWDEDFVTFTDTEQRQGWSMVYVLRRIGIGTTRMEEHLFLKKNVITNLAFRLFMRQKMLAGLATSSANLNAYCKGLVREGRRHPNRVILRPRPPAPTV